MKKSKIVLILSLCFIMLSCTACGERVANELREEVNDVKQDVKEDANDIKNEADSFKQEVKEDLNEAKKEITGNDDTASKIAGYSGAYDKYLQSFVNSYNNYISKDFTPLMNSINADATDEELIRWARSFDNAAEEAEHFYEEFSAAHIIVPENENEKYEKMLEAVYSAHSTFERYDEAADSAEEGNPAFLRSSLFDIHEAMNAVLTLWGLVK